MPGFKSPGIFNINCLPNRYAIRAVKVLRMCRQPLCSLAIVGQQKETRDLD
jgi:hypothetical protein